MARLKRTRVGLYRAFSVQYDALKLSAASYDTGYIGEAVRIANAIYILLGPESGNHKSIVQQLGRETIQKLPNSVLPSKALFAATCTPAVLDDGQGQWLVEATPIGEMFEAPQVSISEWWSETVVKTLDGELSRLALVRIIRNQDGGAHLDEAIGDRSYLHVLKKGLSFQYAPSAEATPVPLEGVLEASLRQMGHEVLTALKGLSITAQHALRQASKKGPLAPQYFEEEG